MTSKSTEAIDQDRRRLLGTTAGIAVAGAASLLHSQVAAAPAGDAIRPFRINVPDEAIADLRRRIAATRWPDKEQVADESQGVRLATVQQLARYWQTSHDWRKTPNVRLPIPIAAFRAHGRLGQLSAISRHNQQLFNHLVGAQQNRWGNGKAERGLAGRLKLPVVHMALGGVSAGAKIPHWKQPNGSVAPE
jgi:hypothetical protein